MQKGLLASGLLLVIYFSVVTLVSGWSFAQEQFRQFWYFVVLLAVGFGVQVGLYAHLRNLHTGHVSSKVVATTGATSTVAMVSCCAHYVVQVLPILGAVGIITVIASYQVELFWVGLAFNLGGIVYMTSKVRGAAKHV